MKQVSPPSEKDKGYSTYSMRNCYKTEGKGMSDLYHPTKTKINSKWYIYTMEYHSAIKKNTFESVVMSWMKLEPIIQSEVSQKEKHQYSILTHIYGI